MAYLDGKPIADDQITPEKHKFIGNFRFPNPPDPKGAVMLCACRHNLHTFEAVRQHWEMGHFDIPQYATIERERQP